LASNGSPVFEENGTLKYCLHGHIQNTPANKVEVSLDDATGEISVSGTMDEAHIYGNKLRLTTTYKTKPGEHGLRFVDTVTNLSTRATGAQLLYHINLGLPLVDPGSKLVMPVAKLAPRSGDEWESVETWDTYGPETPEAEGVCFFAKLHADQDGRTRVVLHNAARKQGLSVVYDTNQLPCFTQWKNAQPEADGYVTGLEPATNYPNERPFEEEKGRVVTLQPGESFSHEIALEAHADAKSVTAALEEVAKLQAAGKPEILADPDPDWSMP
jgi:galactose mutarotase-like enzyme